MNHAVRGIPRVMRPRNALMVWLLIAAVLVAIGVISLFNGR